MEKIGKRTVRFTIDFKIRTDDQTDDADLFEILAMVLRDGLAEVNADIEPEFRGDVILKAVAPDVSYEDHCIPISENVTSDDDNAERVYAKAADECPSCGCKPGDGRTAGCEDPMGCGFAPYAEAHR